MSQKFDRPFNTEGQQIVAAKIMSYNPDTDGYDTFDGYNVSIKEDGEEIKGPFFVLANRPKRYKKLVVALESSISEIESYVEEHGEYRRANGYQQYVRLKDKLLYYTNLHRALEGAE